MQAWIPGSIPRRRVRYSTARSYWSISVEMFLYCGAFRPIALLMIGVGSKPVLLGFALLNAWSSLSEFWCYVDHIPDLAAHLAPGSHRRPEYVDRLLFADNPHQ